MTSAPSVRRPSGPAGARRVRDRAVVCAYRFGERSACLLPRRAVPAVARVAGAVAWAVLPRRRAMVRRHLRRVTGGEARPRPAVVRTAFASYARYWLDTFRLPVVDLPDLDRRARVDGLERIDVALRDGRGAILALPHMGSWDQAGAWLAYRGYPATAVMERLRPEELREWFTEIRRRAGMEVVVRGDDVWAELRRALSENRLVGLVCDRDLSGRGVAVEFFGEGTTVPAGPARLARQVGCPVFPVGIYVGSGDDWSAVVRPAVAFERTDDETADVSTIAQRLVHELEALIRRAPTQWHLMQPNWPSDRA